MMILNFVGFLGCLDGRSRFLGRRGFLILICIFVDGVLGSRVDFVFESRVLGLVGILDMNGLKGTL